MKERSYAVIGLGQFGMTVALTLAEANGDVLAIDENDDNVQDIAEKELGVPFVMAKAMTSLHGRILEKIGADKVIYPEQSMGIRVAKNLLSSGFVDMFELSSDFSMAEFRIPREWVGKTLCELKLRERNSINLICVKQGDDVDVNFNPDTPLPSDCTLIAIGKNEDLNKVSGN